MRRACAALLVLCGCHEPLPPPPSGECVDRGRIDVWAPVDRDEPRGTILACERAESVSADELTASSNFRDHGWTATNGYEERVLQYATDGPSGTARRASALVYLPLGGTPPYPVVAVNHGTNGLGPSCGPTHARITTDYMALPLVGHGYAVVAADYHGMGVDEGVYAYGVGDAEGRAILDAVRALYALSDGDFDGSEDLTDELFLYGHSQGGQATLFAHQLYDSSVGPRLLGSITVAPGLADLRGLDQILGEPARTVDQVSVFMLLLLYSHMTYWGAPDASSWLTPTATAYLPSALRDYCWSTLSVSIPSTYFTNDALFTADFMSAARGCAFDGSVCPAFSPWAGYFEDSLPGNFTSDAPALLIQGEADTIVPPATTSCLADRMTAGGNTVLACGYAGVDHYGIVDASMDDALRWMAARREGRDEDVCPAPFATSCP